MSDHSKRLFRRIVTTARLPCGRVVRSSLSCPLGTSLAEYRQIDAAMCRAFPNAYVMTRGSFL